MKAIKLGVPIFFIILSLFFSISSFFIQKSNLGNEYGPIYFPMGTSLFLLIFSVIYFITELKKLSEDNEELKLLFKGRVLKLIGATTGLGIMYFLIFDKLGYLISTIIYLGLLLFYINGPKKWLVNIIVSISFSFVTWYGFSQLLSVSLP